MNDDSDITLDDVLIGRMAAALAPQRPSSAMAARLRARLLTAARQAEAEAPAAHLTIRAVEGDWFEVMPGVAVKMLREDAATRSYLLRLAPGASLPAHGHTLDEECVVLAGDVWLEGLHAGAGDFHLARGGSRHGAIRTEGGCLLFLRSERYAGDAHPG